MLAWLFKHIQVAPGLEHSKVPPRSHSSSTYLQVYGSATFTLRLLLRLGELRSFGRFGRSSTAWTFESSMLQSTDRPFLSSNSCKPQRLGRHPSCAVSWAPTSRVHSCPALWQLVQLGALCVIDRLGIRYIHWLLSPSIFYRTASWAGHITSRVGVEYVFQVLGLGPNRHVLGPLVQPA